MNTNDTDAIDSNGDEWHKLREERLEMDGQQCANCGDSGMLHVHHVVPKSLGGVNELSNLRTLCVECHDKAHDRSIGVISGHCKETSTRWIPTVDTMSRFVQGIRHPLDRVVVMLLAKTGIGVEELASLELDKIYLRSGGFGLTSTVERPKHPFILLEEADTGPSPGWGERLCDCLIPVGPELQEVLVEYLAIRPDSRFDNLLVSTGNRWGEPLEHSGIRYIVQNHAEKAGFYEVGAGAEENLTPNVFNQFFKNRYQGQPAVRDYMIGKKKEMPFTYGQIATDYRESIYRLLD